MPHDFTVGFRRSGLSLTVLRLDDVPLAFFRKPGSRLKSGTISRLILSAVVVGLYSETATAHGFGQRYDLPVPLALWVVGAGATILLSFVLVVVFARETEGPFRYPRVNLFRWAAFRLLAHPAVLFVIRTGGVIALGAGIAAGFWGDSNPYQNLSPVLVWVIWWVGVVYVCALVADLWALVNPFRTLFAWAEVIADRWLGGRRLSLERPYPEALEMWPAVVGLIGFFWAELLWPGGSVPLNLALAITLYGLVTWIGMVLYGRETWLQNADPFSVMFGVFARFAPLEVRVRSRASEWHCRGHLCRYQSGDCVNGYVCVSHARVDQIEWNLRPPAVGLLQDRRVPVSMMVFVLVLLASVTFGGFLETPIWIQILDRTLGDEIFLVGNVALVLFPMLFCLVYVLFCWLTLHSAALTGGHANEWRVQGTVGVACTFILTLVPIAIAYHLAHYLSFLLITGQYLVPLISDPLGLGWDLLGTAQYRVDIGLLSARVAWYTAVLSVVCGHVFAVYIAHVAARRAFGNARAALWSQIPMIALMVLYTMLSLWILAQPMVG